MSKKDWRRGEGGDDRVEESSAVGDGRQAAMSLMPGLEGTHIHIFESLKLEGRGLNELMLLNCDAGEDS